MASDILRYNLCKFNLKIWNVTVVTILKADVGPPWYAERCTLSLTNLFTKGKLSGSQMGIRSY